ncbi:MAG: YceI family protein [Chloroflexi bacterium]|nr:YceI family protein [Chloroflexota bacterium]
MTASRWPAPALLIVAAVIGIALVGQGDSKSGDLSLPEGAVTLTGVHVLQYEVGEGSEITFTVREKLSRLPLPSDAVVRTESLSGRLNFDGQPSEVTVDLLSLSSDQSFRDRYMRDRMFRDFPDAVFTVNDLTDLPPEFFSGEIFTGQVAGTLSVNGIDVPLTFDLEVRNDGDVLNVLGRTEFTWDQLRIRVPNIRNIVSVEDKVSVQLLLVARPK